MLIFLLHASSHCTQVSAEKQITIEEAPNILTIHLKRFQFGGKGSKITKGVNYEQALNLQPFMSRPECGPQVCVHVVYMCVCVCVRVCV
jgi:ubiquitin C-terminal hydrolase